MKDAKEETEEGSAKPNLAINQLLFSQKQGILDILSDKQFEVRCCLMPSLIGGSLLSGFKLGASLTSRSVGSLRPGGADGSFRPTGSISDAKDVLLWKCT